MALKSKIMKQELVDLEGAIATDKIKHNYLVDYQNVSLIKISRVLQFYLFLFKKFLFSGSPGKYLFWLLKVNTNLRVRSWAQPTLK